MQDIKVCTADAPRVDWQEAVTEAIRESGDSLLQVVRGDFAGLADVHDVSNADMLRGVIVTGKKWQVGRTIKVAFYEDGYYDQVINRVKPYFLEWTKHANLKFEFVNQPQDAEIRVSFVRGDGSWSYIGTDALTIPKSQATMNFGWLTPSSPEDEYSRVVLHEVGHALGMPHEHQHPEGGIPWDKEAVYRYYSGPPNNWDRATIDRNLFARYSKTITQFTEGVDPQSIMMYAIPEELTVGTWSVGWNRTLSKNDKAFAAEQYPGRIEPEEPDNPDEKELLQRLRTRRANLTRQLERKRPLFLAARDAFVRHRDEFRALQDARAETVKRIQELLGRIG